MAHVWINLAQDADGYPPVTEEELHTEPVGPNLHRLLATPAFAYGIAVGDVLRSSAVDDGTEWVVAVEEQGDHWCSRIVPFGDVEMQRIVDLMTSMGGTATATTYGLVTADFGPTVDAGHVLAELQAGREDGDWDYDLGVRPPG